jgi:hypothetical protein
LCQETLNPGRLAQPEDWVRQEIEWALSMNKKIIPIITEGFCFPEAQTLPESIRSLSTISGVRIPHDYFNEAMEKLIKDYLIEKKPSNILPNDVLDRYIFLQEESIDFDE